MAKTLEQEFLELVGRIYPDPPVEGSEQMRMLREMFFAGCLVAYTSSADFAGELKEHAVLLHAATRGKAGA